MNRNILHSYRFISIFLVLICFGLAACGPATPTEPLPTATMGSLDIIKSFENAYNAHDFEAMKSLLTETPIFMETNWGIYEPDLKSTQKRFEFYFGGNTTIRLSECSSTADQVACKLEYSDDCFQAAGVSPYHETATFLLGGNKIKKITWDDDQQDDEQAYKTYLEKFLPWLESKYVDVYNQMMNDEISFEFGNKLSEKCKEYVSQ